MDGRKQLTMLLLVMTVETRTHSQNRIFKKMSEIIITWSKWLITLMIGLKPYELLLERFRSEVIKSGKTRGHVLA